jgi:hypothetical protein
VRFSILTSLFFLNILLPISIYFPFSSSLSSLFDPIMFLFLPILPFPFYSSIFL